MSYLYQLFKRHMRGSRRTLKLVCSILGVFLLGSISHAAWAQFYHGSNISFGKNRVQHQDLIWSYYKFDRFNLYFYSGGKNTAIYTAKTAQKTLDELQKTFDYYLEDKVYFLLYNKLEHFRQSNIGLEDGEQYNIGGVTRISGNKVFVYFEGDHEKLERQIRSGLARIIFNKMMFGNNLKDMVKNSTLLNLPEWYSEGLISYVTDSRSLVIDNRLRDGMLDDRFKKFNRLTGEDARDAGHSLWAYVAETYGENVIPNILYMARISRNVESGFLFVLGVSLKTLLAESETHYKNKYKLEEDARLAPGGENLDFRIRKNRKYTQLRIHPDGDKVAFVTNQMGQFRVYTYDLSTGKKKQLMKGNHKLDRINDESYPLLDWSPRGDNLAIIYEKKGEVQLSLYLLEEKKMITKPIFRLERITSFTYSPDGKSMIFSAFKDGQTDLYEYRVSSNSQTKITDDLYDDLYPAYVEKGRYILFSSNRDSEMLDVDSKSVPLLPADLDLYVYDVKTKSKQLRRVTETPGISETFAQPYDQQLYTFLADENGIINRYIGRPDSAIASIDTTFNYRYFTKTNPITNYYRNILEHDVDVESAKYAEIVYLNGRYRLMVGNFGGEPQTFDLEFRNTDLKDAIEQQDSQSALDEQRSDSRDLKYETIDVFSEDVPVSRDSGEIDIDNYKFESEPVESEKTSEGSRFIRLEAKKNKEENDSTKTEPATAEEALAEEPEEFRLPQNRNYNINFVSTDIVTQFDFDFTNDVYQRFNGGPYFNPGMGGFAKLGIIDLFEDYKLEGGFRYSFNNNNVEYLLSFLNRSRRLDRQYVFNRQTITYVNEQNLTRNITYQGRAIYKWPFSEVAAVRFSFMGRRDRLITLSTNRQSLEIPDDFINWGGAKLEYIFDNTLDRGLNLYNGLRFKLFAEYQQEIGAAQSDMTVVGADFRHYQKLHRSLIWANRFAASTSFGSRRLVYYMGSVDNWIVLGDRERFDFDTQISQDQNYYFQTIATNMRGFIQNARNGNSFAVLNSELRWPVFKYFLNKPIKSDLISNFQLIGFGDLGTAWTGDSPYSEDNSFNTDEIVNNPLTITLKNQKDPLIGSYGIGLRTKLWGYFVRFDYAWGVEDRQVLEPITHLSLGLDF
ncbi:MAG: hypothetical protein ACFB10_05175 [Salibacteraceae bacterium]